MTLRRLSYPLLAASVLQTTEFLIFLRFGVSSNRGLLQDRLTAVAVDFELHFPVQIAAPVFFIPNFHSISPKIWLIYRFRQSMKMGTCCSQDASEWVPPGTIRKARFTRLVRSRCAVEIMASWVAAWLNISSSP